MTQERGERVHFSGDGRGAPCLTSDDDGFGTPIGVIETRADGAFYRDTYEHRDEYGMWAYGPHEESVWPD